MPHSMAKILRLGRSRVAAKLGPWTPPGGATWGGGTGGGGGAGGVFPPAACRGGGATCYRIKDYVDGDFTPGPGPGCQAEYATTGRNPCAGAVLNAPTWDGGFFLDYNQSVDIPNSDSIWIWNAHCNNLVSGDVASGNMCVSNRLIIGGGVNSLQILRRCSFPGVILNKTLTIDYASASGVRTMWQGEGDHIDAEIAGFYLRTGGDDLTASIQVVHCVRGYGL